MFIFLLIPTKMLFLFIFLCSSIFLLLLYNFHWKRRSLPPGPMPIPIFGNVGKMGGENRYKCYQEWTKEYGPVFTIWISEHPVVIVTDYELIKGAFLKEGDSFVDRNFLHNHFRLFFGSVDGIFRSNGEQWKQMRKFMFKSMKDYGIEGENMENKILQSIFVLIKEIEEEMAGGKREHEIDRKVELMAGTVTNKMLYSSGFEDKKEIFLQIKAHLNAEQAYFASIISLLIEASPWLRHLPYFSGKFKWGKESVEFLFKNAQKQIDERIQWRNNGGETFGDILDQFLDQIEKSDQNDVENYFKLRYLPALIFDIFFSAQDTTSNTINFLIYYLMMDQNAQEKVHAELDGLAKLMNIEAPVEGSFPFLAFRQIHRRQLPFTNAVVHETQRLCNLAPMNLSRTANVDVRIGGHNLPSGTTLVPQISTVLFDERIFPEAEKFVPTRFLDENGEFKKMEEFIPFGIGKRICPGETLAKMELFLFAANFFYKFHVYPVDPLNPPKYEKVESFAVRMADYKCHVEARN